MADSHNITVKVLEVTPGTIQSGANAGGEYIKVKWEQNGKEFTKTCFDTMQIAAFRAGLDMNVPVDVTLSADWKKIEDATLSEPTDSQPPKTQVAEPTKKAPAKQFKADPDKTDSIEAQVAFKGIVDLLCSGKLSMDGICARWAMVWALTKMGAEPMNPDVLQQYEMKLITEMEQLNG